MTLDQIMALREVERRPLVPDCVCDYDCVGDPARYVRCNKASLCPAHDQCEDCGAALATAIVDGEKLCAFCAGRPGSR